MEKNTVVELEEMDWQTTKTSAIEGIRQNLLQLEINYDILEKAELRLKQMFDLLPKEEQDRRNKINCKDCKGTGLKNYVKCPTCSESKKKQ